MRARHWILAQAAAGLLAAAAPASAHHLVWLDFSGFNLSAYPNVNGHPPTFIDISIVQQLVIANVVEDYAPFDVHITTLQPAQGRYSRMLVLSNDENGLFGTVGDCLVLNCTGIDSWRQDVSAGEVYAGSFAGAPEFQGANATSTRIANGISHTISHELGHLLSLRHCHSADDFVSAAAACTNGFGATADQNANHHIMASGASTGLTMAERATRDRFFSLHSERRVLYGLFQPRNHWAPLGDVTGGGRADVTFATLEAPLTVGWTGQFSNGATFGGPVDLTQFGRRTDLFLSADVTGDGRHDLVVGRLVDPTTVDWFVAPATGAGFGAAVKWITGGDVGDIFRLGDVNGDGRADLVYGRPAGDTVTWFVRLSTGTAFGAFTTFIADAGDEDDLFLLDDVTGDGRADLVAATRSFFGGTNTYRSTGAAFVLEAGDSILSYGADLVLVGDVTGDGRADLVSGFMNGDTTVEWTLRPSNGCALVQCFLGSQAFSANAGDSGDHFRLGDGNGDGRLDLFYARPALGSRTAPPNLALVRWFGQLSNGSTLSSATLWSADAGDEGVVFP
jgi:hypothetical protein